jgi:YihY family inner membrane protein
LRRRLSAPLVRTRTPLHAPGGRWVRGFFVKAYYENLTGLSGMVAYNFLLSIFPLALLALFVFGLVLRSPSLEESALRDLREIFPTAATSTLSLALEGIRRSSTSFGLVALVASLWIGSSFWGALDTAFGQIYRVPCRTWVQQKRFGVAMLGVVLVFMAATVFVPAVQALLRARARDLPLGLAEVEGLVFVLTLGGGLVVLFGIFCVIFWTVPNRRVGWPAIWPGAIGATVATGVVDFGFPLYLSNVSTLAQVGTTFVFVLVVLIWFYVLSAILLGGATINALRLDALEGRQPGGSPGPPPPTAVPGPGA